MELKGDADHVIVPIMNMDQMANLLMIRYFMQIIVALKTYAMKLPYKASATQFTIVYRLFRFC